MTYTITASQRRPEQRRRGDGGRHLPGRRSPPPGPASAPAAAPAPPRGSGNINDTVNLPAGGSVTYTASCHHLGGGDRHARQHRHGRRPGGVTDPDPGNNSATDTDTLAPQADLAITKTDGVTTATPGGSRDLHHHRVATPVRATPPGRRSPTPSRPSLTATWTCVGAGGGTCTASGSGNINDTVNLPSGGSVTYTASATISAAATGTLSNTATVTRPGRRHRSHPGQQLRHRHRHDTDQYADAYRTPSATPTQPPTSTPTPSPTATPTQSPTLTQTPTLTERLHLPLPHRRLLRRPPQPPPRRPCRQRYRRQRARPAPTQVRALAATPTLTSTPPPTVHAAAADRAAPSSGGSPPRPPTPTPTPPPDCGQTGSQEEFAPSGYASNPGGAQGQNHPVYNTGLTTLAEREAFRSSLPGGTHMAVVNDAIARGCSPAWIRSHLGG